MAALVSSFIFDSSCSKTLLPWTIYMPAEDDSMTVVSGRGPSWTLTFWKIPIFQVQNYYEIKANESWLLDSRFLPLQELLRAGGYYSLFITRQNNFLYTLVYWNTLQGTKQRPGAWINTDTNAIAWINTGTNAIARTRGTQSWSRAQNNDNNEKVERGPSIACGRKQESRNQLSLALPLVITLSRSDTKSFTMSTI